MISSEMQRLIPAKCIHLTDYQGRCERNRKLVFEYACMGVDLIVDEHLRHASDLSLFFLTWLSCISARPVGCGIPPVISVNFSCPVYL